MRLWNHVVLVNLLYLMIPQGHAVSTLLTNFPQLVRAIESGDDVKAIVHFERCLNTNQNQQNQISQNIEGASTRFNLTQYLHYKARVNDQLKDSVISTSSHFIPQDNGDVWILYGELIVYEDNTTFVHVEYDDPIHHTKHFVGDWECDISNGRDNNGLYLYDQ